MPVTLFADPDNYPDTARGSWLFPRGFRQRAVTSPLGNVRFSGVPAGRIIVGIKTPDANVEERATAKGGDELLLTLRVP